ncbi:MAG: PEP-CTERM sorting domain-containing protein [Planctomycetota bacterium]
MTFRNAMTALALAGITGAASAQPTITEVYIGGLDGPDGTADWFELTNFGDTTLIYAAGDLLYEDESRDLGTLDPFPAFSLAPGESFVFLLDDDTDGDVGNDDPADDVPPNGIPDAFEAFDAVWGSGINRGLVDGSGLGGGGDEANVYLAGAIEPLLSFAYTEEDADGSLFGLQTFDVLNGTYSTTGVNGAFTSNPFANTQQIPGQTELSLQGSPGVAVPEPATAALLGLGGLAMLRRRSA